VIFRPTVTVVIGINGLIPAAEEANLMTNMSTGNSSGNRTMHIYLLIVGAFLSEVFRAKRTVIMDSHIVSCFLPVMLVIH
jgi:hypothetical protein